MIIDDVRIGPETGTFFIADLAANHDGSIRRAKKLIKLAHDSGANAVKFQHFQASQFINGSAFEALRCNKSHQTLWEKSVYDVYADASLPLSWTEELKNYCLSLGIVFFSSPYGLDMVDHLNPHVPAWKIGSGDINYHAQLIRVAKTNKPVLLATGACALEEVIESVNILQKYTNKIVLMQCNTNYTAKDENYDFINLNVLKTYSTLFPDIVLGLSDHTLGHETVLGAIALGARVVEKHFTDDNSRPGPDHQFSMNPQTWKEMVKSSRIIERSLGSTIKAVCKNEKETSVLQRRALYAIDDIPAGTHIDNHMFEPKRPCPPNSVNINKDLNFNKTRKPLLRGQCLREDYLE